jgi:hypothetical protein
MDAPERMRHIGRHARLAMKEAALRAVAAPRAIGRSADTIVENALRRSSSTIKLGSSGIFWALLGLAAALIILISGAVALLFETAA